MTWYNKYGFEDTYGIGVTKEVADKYNLKTYSDLAKVSNQLSFGAESDFFLHVNTVMMQSVMIMG